MALGRAGALTAAKAGRTRGRVGPLAALEGADGVVNCAPLGMDSFPGSPVPVGAFPQAAWVFDAVYTPVDAPFRARTQAARARFLPGWGLFFHQRVDAVEIFTGHRLDAEALTALRARLRVLETEPPRRLSGGT